MKIAVVTLGCKVNQYESDSLVRALKLDGHDCVNGLVPADMYIINTCAVTSEAEKKSRQMIARCKKLSPHAKVIVCGCASQNNPTQFEDKANLIFGVAKKSLITEKLKGHGQKVFDLPTNYEDTMTSEQSKTRAYIKIQDGCNNFCTYCLIPYLRGRSRSREPFSVINEVINMPDEIKEIVLIGINITDYKIDGKPALIDLMLQLDKVGKRLRLGSIEDSLITKETLLKLKQIKNFCPHFHLSLQSGSDSVLKKMNRHYTTKEFYKSVRNIRKIFPTAGITTDIIVGFPTETGKEFEESLKFVEKCGFSYLHIFPYSKRPNTVASRMEEVPIEVKKARVKLMEQLNTKLMKRFMRKNKTASVLVEEKRGDYYVGHSDNYLKCYIHSNENIINQIVQVKVIKMGDDGVFCTIL